MGTRDGRHEDDDDDGGGRLPDSWKVSRDVPFPSGAEIERRFEETLRSRWGGRERRAPADVFVHGSELLVEVDLPGVERESVRVRVESGWLLVEAHRPGTSQADEARAARLERPRGPIHQRVPLPAPLARARVEFALEAGVLRVRLQPEEDE